MVLQLTIPALSGDIAAALKNELFELVPNVLIYMLSFLTITIFWISHTNFFQIIGKVDRVLLWLNSLFLMFLALIPFPTAIISEHPLQPLAAALYGGTMFFTSILFLLMISYSMRTNVEMEKSHRSTIIARGTFGPVVYFKGVALSFVSPPLALLCYIIVPGFYTLAGFMDKSI